MATNPPEPALPTDSAFAHHCAAPVITPVTLAGAWAGLHEQADALATLAQFAASHPQISPQISPPFSHLIAAAQPWQHHLVHQGIEDITAMLGCGMAALATLSGRGQDTTAPALALWREFHAARAALLAVLGHQDTA